MVPEKMKPASAWPLVLALLSILSSLVLGLLPMMRLVSNSNFATSLVGWLLGPVMAFTLYGVDVNLQKSPKNRALLIAKPGYTAVLRILAYASILIGLMHAWRVSSLLSVVA
jgi:hypothetical protein